MKSSHAMQLINVLDFGGAESLALNISMYLNKLGKCQTSVCGLFGGEGPLVGHAEKNEVKVYFFKSDDGNRLKVMWNLYRLLKEQNVTVVQVHGSYLLQYAAFPAKLAGVRLIYTEHAKYSLCKSRKLRRNARYFSLLVDKVVCVSNDLKNFLINDIGVNPYRVEVVHNGVNLSAFQPKKIKTENRSDQDKLIIGTVARLSDPKDHTNLLHAFSQVVKIRPNLQLILVGDGELRPNIENMIQELNIWPHVKMLGRRSDIPDLLASMDLFVLASKREGFPIALLEAMACGKPVIATDVGGVKEIISNCEDGIIVQSESSEALAGAILKLSDDKALRDSIAARGYEKVQSNFSEQAMMEKYMKLLIPSGEYHES
ncbi:glycosyltransferase [Desulfatitalea alkaliphila]|uniref:Glycosyltransferase n=1 Tax=Desulfatitalea alkaliphila TaxID=2929485 RepID=A0AA41R4D9_9BACT|nr:glycosyltransferase [Desulfatitalea alkaliphila]MCJ8503132.1 glycosyltransferase [Desulfatitalea alkaliphila]